MFTTSQSAGRTVSPHGGPHYTASKAGMLGLTRAAAKELGKFGITVNAVCPGMIDTELTHENATPELLARLAASYPIPRLGTAIEVADLVCFLASEQAGYMTGTSIDISGGRLVMQPPFHTRHSFPNERRHANRRRARRGGHRRCGHLRVGERRGAQR